MNTEVNSSIQSLNGTNELQSVLGGNSETYAEQEYTAQHSLCDLKSSFLLIPLMFSLHFIVVSLCLKIKAFMHELHRIQRS